MTRHLSQHKVSRRVCPGCGEEKSYPVRQKYCSGECAQKNATKPVAEGLAIQGNTLTVSLPRTSIHTLPELIAYAQVDEREWAVDRFEVNNWEMARSNRQVSMAWKKGRADGTIQDDGAMTVQPLFQVKATFKRKVAQISVAQEIAAMKEDALKAPRLWRKVPHGAYPKTGYLLEMSIPDLHLGKFADSLGTGWLDYNIAAAEKHFRAAVDALRARTASYPLEQIALVIGNDLLHIDNDSGTTHAGTQMAPEGSYHRLFRKARELMVATIDQLRETAPVIVPVVYGNHDELASWHLGESLQCWYNGCKDVTVLNDPQPRKYYQWGKVMLMWTHSGKEGHLADYPLLMATEQARMFGETCFREVHVGDMHQVRLQEKHGIRVRILPALSGTDQWHANHGFVGNILSAEAYVWHREEGLVGTATYSIPQPR